MAQEVQYIQVLLPLPLKGTFTYFVPDELMPLVKIGCRVEVRFGRSKIYSGLVESFTDQPPEDYKIKPILDVLDDRPIVGELHLQFWKWIADYYGCSRGEVMAAALPGPMKLHSQSILVRGFAWDEEHDHLSDEAWLIREALTDHSEIDLDEARAIAGRKNIGKFLEELIYNGVVELKEELKEKFKPVSMRHYSIVPKYLKDPGKALDAAKNSNPQTAVLLTLFQKKDEPVPISRLKKNPEIKRHALDALEKKGIIESQKMPVSRLSSENKSFKKAPKLSEEQTQAILQIKESWKDKEVALLHGVTGSGKTVLYIELMKEVLDQGGQVLYLLPEIGLTQQIIKRIEASLDHPVHVFHSRENVQKKVEVWKAAMDDKGLIIGARSSVFLPCTNLKLIVVDEEHDPSYKQQNPAPRYHGRDAAIYLARLTGAKLLLGTATPSLESFFNVRKKKYGYCLLENRYGEAVLPETQLVNIKKARLEKRMKGPFSNELLEEIKSCVADQKQVILFQNRRGYSPSIQCAQCSWIQECHQCDVSMTLHMRMNEMKCHYCSHTANVPSECPACGSTRLEAIGFGTEKVEDELSLLMPDLKMARMDQDTTRSKKALHKLLYDFETGVIDVLVGTQMVTKGLDFENVGLVGVLNADQLFNFPDFRASERGFQMLTQVSGRAGRSNSPGKVLIQTGNPEHPILQDVLNADFKNFFYRELRDRGKYRYPPFYRNIKLEIKHKDLQVVWKAARIIKDKLEEKFGNRVLGPAEPMIPRIRSHYLLEFMFKVEKDAEMLTSTKIFTTALLDHVRTKDPFKSLKYKLDVDPV